MIEYIQVGKIVNTHGVKGEVRIIPTTDDSKRFELLKSIFIQTRTDLVEYPIQHVRYHKNFVLLQLEGINDMTTAEKFKNYVVKIPKEWALPLEEDEYYIGDLYGVDVITEDGEMLGKIIDILFTGSNDVYVIKGDEPSSKELLIPAIKQCILKVDIVNKQMTVHLLEGLR